MMCQFELSSSFISQIIYFATLTVLNGVLNCTETVADGILDLVEGVAVGALDKNRNGLGIRDLLDECVSASDE